ncbi:MAG: hypothetical protein LBB88_00900 [Planctomycetaceae bacterium]|nr:hypothetical protein [Planctomycetaceae bacterium]
MILIIVESILSLPSATRPFGERSPTRSVIDQIGDQPDQLPPTDGQLLRNMNY